MKKLTLASVLAFGKHNGKTIEWVCENDPSYILWIDENTDFVLSNTAFSAAKLVWSDSMLPDPYDGLEDSYGDRDDY